MTARPSIDLSDVPVVDGHAHPLLRDPCAVSADAFLNLFSEGRPGAMAAHVTSTGYFMRACRELARRLGTDPTVEAVLAARAKLGIAGVSRMLAGSRVAAVLADTGYPAEAMTLDEMRRVMPCAVHEVFRVETCAQGLLGAALTYEEFLDVFRAALHAAAAHAVSFKSIIAYRSGLAVKPPDHAEARRAYGVAVTRVEAGGTRRLTEKPLLDALFRVTLEVARETRRPVQVHSGFGDPDIDLVQSNPLLLRPIVDDPEWADVRMVLLHLSYPYFREAAFMTAVYPQVSLDLSLAIPFLGPGVATPLTEVLSLAPATKLLYGSDVSAIPELFALSADWGRAALGEALGWLVERDGLTDAQARDVGRRVLADNATALYGLGA